ncbi:MAG: UTP--glucose-1-phosphate uridylyltransferase [bacterium]|nr:UTP--glucose-1-phosphate uridylyltransferase [bacterium]
MVKKIKKALLPVAGLGTRFLPATKVQPKEMLPIVDKPVVQYLVEEIAASGIKEIIFITGREKRAIEDHFDASYELERTLVEKGKPELAEQMRGISKLAHFSYVRQKFPRGDGDALLQARKLLGEDEAALVVFGDCLYDSDVPTCQQLLDSYEKFNAPIIGLAEISRSEVSKFGVINGVKIDEKHWEIKSFIEKPSEKEAPTTIVAPGKYIITPAVFKVLEDLEKKESSGELRLANAFEIMLKRGDKIYGRMLEGQWLDTGDKFNFLKANIHFGLKHPDIGAKLRAYIKSL